MKKTADDLDEDFRRAVEHDDLLEERAQRARHNFWQRKKLRMCTGTKWVGDGMTAICRVFLRWWRALANAWRRRSDTRRKQLRSKAHNRDLRGT